MRTATSAIISKWTQVHINRPRGKVGAVGVTDATKFVDCCDKSADETEVDKCDEECRTTSRAETEEGGNCPSAGEDGDDEEYEDERGG